MGATVATAVLDAVAVALGPDAAGETLLNGDTDSDTDAERLVSDEGTELTEGEAVGVATCV